MTTSRRAAAAPLWGLLLLWSGPLLAQNGYAVRGGQVVVDRARHWEAWTMPTHLVRLERDGTVRSREFRGVFELLSDQSFGRPVVLTRDAPRIANVDSTVRLDFRGDPVRDASDNLVYDHVVRPGVSRAGSNPHLMHYIADGDPETFWEPDLDDPPEDWWVEVGLGRPVPLERIRLSFVEEGLGDPFYRFLFILGPAHGTYMDDLPRNLETLVAFDGVNTDRRTFVFDAERVGEDLPADHLSDPERRLPITDSNKRASGYYGVPEPSLEWSGKLVELIRIVVTDTRAGRAEEIEEEEWQALPAAERGDIVHFLRDGDFEEPVSEETWLSLPEDRRGGRVHYRRELPRLAEVEAWGQGDDIGIELVGGGGSVEHTSASGTPGMMFDGSYGSFNTVDNYIVSQPEKNTTTVDMGGTVWLKEVRTTTITPFRGYRLRSSIGARDAQGNLQWERFSSEERETNLHHGWFRLLADVLPSSRPARFLEMIGFALQEDHTERSPVELARVRLMWIFAEGPTADAVLESDLIELPEGVTLGAVRWEADAPPRIGGADPHPHRRPVAGASPLLRQGRGREDGVPVQEALLHPEGADRHLLRGGSRMEPLEPQVRAPGRSGHFTRAAPVHEDPGSPSQSRPRDGAGDPADQRRSEDARGPAPGSRGLARAGHRRPARYLRGLSAARLPRGVLRRG